MIREIEEKLKQQIFNKNNILIYEPKYYLKFPNFNPIDVLSPTKILVVLQNLPIWHLPSQTKVQHDCSRI